MNCMSLFPSSFQGRIRYCQSMLFGRRCIRLANQTPIISFTFDDFPRSALYSGGSILEEYGLAATYYTALGLMDTKGPVGQMFSEEDLSEVLNRGHELGCHTYDHCDTWNTHPSTFEDSILRNRQALRQFFPKASFSSFAYPKSIPRPQTKKMVQKHFLGCRGCSQMFNTRSTDLNLLNAFFLEQRRSDASVKALIDRNARCLGWLIFATHDIALTPSRFGCTPTFFKETVRYAIASGATVLPMAAALRRICGSGS